jgi:trehalose 6-phosphate synthase
MKATMLSAYQADSKDLTRRMKAMRRTVADNDVAHWASTFLEQLTETRATHDKTTRPAQDS